MLYIITKEHFYVITSSLSHLSVQSVCKTPFRLQGDAPTARTAPVQGRLPFTSAVGRPRSSSAAAARCEALRALRAVPGSSGPRRAHAPQRAAARGAVPPPRGRAGLELELRPPGLAGRRDPPAGSPGAAPGAGPARGPAAAALRPPPAGGR